MEDTVLKTVVLYRHGQGAHNVRSTADSLAILDAPLTEQGETEARAIFACSSFQPEVVFVSPLQRTLQTATLALEVLASTAGDTQPPPVYALEAVRGVLGNNACNHRRGTSTAQSEFPGVNFELIEDEHGPNQCSEYRDDLKDEINCVRARAAGVLDMLCGRTETAIAVFTHAGFIRNLQAEVIGLGAHHGPGESKTGGGNEIRLIAGKGACVPYWVLTGPVTVTAIPAR
jgi:broad specificity phosphatase PhoE